MGEIKPSRILYIKLGRGGLWERESIDKSKIILDYHEVNHRDCLNRNWEAVYRSRLPLRKKPGAARSDVTQIKYFYEADESVLWITFYGDRMWWCFSKPLVTELKSGYKSRSVIGKWMDADIHGTKLSRDQISSKLRKIAAFQGTICNVKETQYVLNKINGRQSKELIEARTTVRQLKEKISDLITDLDWKDFETLIDLIFRQAGLQRISVVGEQEKIFDLKLCSPITNEKWLVQIKSDSNLREFQDYCQKFKTTNYERFFYVVHTMDNKLSNFAPKDSTINVWKADDVADQVVKLGLVDWVISKTS